MPPPVVRRATRKDIGDIVDFNKAMALETEIISLDSKILAPGVEEIFKDPTHGFYIVCEVEETVRACLMITYEWSDWRNGLFWWIQSVYVQKEYRELGLYKQMYEFVKTLTDRSKNVVGIRLYVDHDNTKAQNVYTKLGMTKSNYQLFEYNKLKGKK
ncbi:MAG: GNAT family N-acetyltransferase [Candidatus Marinimicrobia bacterium]|jgi:ribosomal protein S18 acetylase RimI-like enzyme|nr:GNAT family N-acetyltransferase [Candidatus Neomarinimicrobiota bacterium]MBT3630155.1 GNAT family N-acetyltransferase [Candidatus Neomarinimicrobiota bacterium]MBT3826107.1 GNAT family N-acetyltransferase [Candidatus Neomarinimicrobiota bacterium]MBT4132141.1 GNAT family N-acetyltransferase [Candidatus Neomarinimicrobiota bacterium]MBT4296628.1 GNAT family N-acetyltransferase [Candidatus Neomarinimicrobiota bacterium]